MEGFAEGGCSADGDAFRPPGRPPSRPSSRSTSVGAVPSKPSQRRTPTMATTAPRMRKAAGVGAGSKNVMGFFASVERSLEGEWRELEDHERALQAQRRMLRKQAKEEGRPPPPESPAGEWTKGRRPRSGTGRGSHCGLPTPPRLQSTYELSEGAAQYLLEWELHDEAWALFHEKPPYPLSVDCVPWPPCNKDVLEFCERMHAPGERKQAYRIACRRWHPDKFLQRYGSLVVPEDLPGLTMRLNDVFQAVSTQWELIQPSKDG
mmetsp:Transcript_22590/g.48234  ORF Transcript_22590/g.48234 Transcript_22590/m.48234 type:complete len:263 (-) Transcript_22590:78-866(-)